MLYVGGKKVVIPRTGMWRPPNRLERVLVRQKFWAGGYGGEIWRVDSGWDGNPTGIQSDYTESVLKVKDAFGRVKDVEQIPHERQTEVKGGIQGPYWRWRKLC